MPMHIMKHPRNTPMIPTYTVQYCGSSGYYELDLDSMIAKQQPLMLEEGMLTPNYLGNKKNKKMVLEVLQKIIF